MHFESGVIERCYAQFAHGARDDEAGPLQGMRLVMTKVGVSNARREQCGDPS